MSTKVIDMFKSVYEMIKLHKTYTELLEKRIVLLLIEPFRYRIMRGTDA
jgi:hypothetical protein